MHAMQRILLPHSDSECSTLGYIIIESSVKPLNSTINTPIRPTFVTGAADHLSRHPSVKVTYVSPRHPLQNA